MRAVNAVQCAQPLDSVQAGNDALVCQFAPDLLWAIDTTTALMCRPNCNQQAHVFKFARRYDFAGAPCLIAAFGNVQQSTQLGYGVLISEFINHGVSHFDSFAKNAVAFFKMSRSIFAIANSRSNSRMRC